MTASDQLQPQLDGFGNRWSKYLAVDYVIRHRQEKLVVAFADNKRKAPLLPFVATREAGVHSKKTR
jgi:hypothetical protein